MPFVTSFERLGHARGVSEGLRESVKLILETRFQQPGRDLFTEVDAIKDADILRRVISALSTPDSLESVRAVWSK